MKIKAAFFDIDGTILSHRTHAVPEDTRKALYGLRERGIKIFTSTGRHMLELEQLPIPDIEFDGYVLLNGQLCLDHRRKVLAGSPIEEYDIQQVLPLFQKRELPIVFVEKDRIYINFIDERVRIAQEAISTALPELGAAFSEAALLDGLKSEASSAEVLPDFGGGEEVRGAALDLDGVGNPSSAGSAVPDPGGHPGGL